MARTRRGASSASDARATRGRGRGRGRDRGRPPLGSHPKMKEGDAPELGGNMPVEEEHHHPREQEPPMDVGHLAAWGQESPVEERRERQWMEIMAEMMGNARRGSSTVFGDFVRTNPPTFEGAYNPLSAQAWLENIEKVLDAIGCTDRERVNLAAYQLRGRVDGWWKWIKRSYNEDTNTWEVFKGLLYEKYFPESLQDQKEIEFIQLTQ